MSSASDIFTRANGLTFLRLASVPFLVLAILHGRRVEATLWFTFAVATDFADGWVARRWSEVSPFGGLADHAVDATLAAAGTAALAQGGILPWALPPLIALAFLQYVLDSGAISGKALRASFVGRWNGIAYYVIVAVPIVRDSLGWAWPGEALVRFLGWALVASTLVSMGDRLWARFGRQ